MDLKGREPIFEPLSVRSIDFRNRVWVPAMCQYSAVNGLPTSWHDAHYANLATGVGCVIVEATAISPIARVTPEDLLLDASTDLSQYIRVASLIRERGAIPGIQLSHSGRKGSRSRPWDGDVPITLSEGGWETIGPSRLAFATGYPIPREMSEAEIHQTVADFANSAQLAYSAGFRVIEVHAGHGRLLHSFLSPLSNVRHDKYGGEIAERARFLRIGNSTA